MTLVMIAVVGGQESQIRLSAGDTMFVGDVVPDDSVQFIFPRVRSSSGNTYIAGNATIIIEPLKAHESSATDSLWIWVRPVFLIDGSYVISRGDSILLIGELDWDNGYLYQYPLNEPFGPSQGLQVFGRFGASAVNDTINVFVWMVVQ